MASSCNVVILSSGDRLSHPDVAATQPVDSHAAPDDPAQDAEALPGDALANVSVTDLHNLVAELHRLRDENSRLQLQLEQASSTFQCLRCVSFEQDIDHFRQELSSASRLLLAQREDNALLQDELARLRSLSDEVDQLRRRVAQQDALIDTQRSELHRAREASLALHRQPFQPALPTVNFASTPVSRPPSQPLVAPPRSSPRWSSPISEGPDKSALNVSASEMNELIANVIDVIPVAYAGSPYRLEREHLPDISPAPWRIDWVLPGHPPPGAHVLPDPVLTVKSVANVTLTPKLDTIVWRKGEDFFHRSLALFETLRSELSAKDLFGLLAALVKRSLRVCTGDGVLDAAKRAALADMCQCAQRPYAGISPLSPLLLVFADYQLGAETVYVTYATLARIEALLFELLRKSLSAALQQELFQRTSAPLSSLSLLATYSHYAFTAGGLDYTLYRQEVHHALEVKFNTRAYATFRAYLQRLCMQIAFFNTAFGSTEYVKGADFVDWLHLLLGTPAAVRLNIDMHFPRGDDRRLGLQRPEDEFRYLAMLEEMLPSLGLSSRGSVASVGALHFDGQRSNRKLPESDPVESGSCSKCRKPPEACRVCEVCLVCNHDTATCYKIKSSAVPSEPDFTCQRCKGRGHYPSSCSFLTADLMQGLYRDKSREWVLAQPARIPSSKGKRNPVISIGKAGPNGTVVKMFKHAARQVINDPAKCGSLIASVLDTTITPSQAKQDAVFLAELERQFAAQRPEATRPRA